MNESARTRPPAVAIEWSRAARSPTYEVPGDFQLARSKPVGRYPLLDVFGGLTKTPPFHKYPGDDRVIREIAESSWARVIDSEGWMYVAPRKVPIEVRAAGFQMVTSTEEEIVVSRRHLSTSPAMYLYLDVIHEFLHILQRRYGRDLWPGLKVPYVDRHTEIEAYAFSIAEARRLGVSDAYLREYLKVDWIERKDYLRRLRNVGVPLARRVARTAK